MAYGIKPDDQQESLPNKLSSLPPSVSYCIDVCQGWTLDLCPHTGLSFLDPADRLVQGNALAVFLVSAAAGRDQLIWLFFTLLAPGINRISAPPPSTPCNNLSTWVTFPTLAAVTTKLVYQAGTLIDANVRFRSKVVLVAFLGLVYFRVTLAVFVLGRPGA